MKKIIFSILVCCVIFGCESTCVKVGGGYTGSDGTKIEGDVEFCPSSESKTVGLPVFEGDAGKAVLLTEKQVSKLLEKVEPEKKSILNVSPMKRLSELVK